MSSFHVDQRIDVKLEFELAIRLGELILNCGTEDKQILALGHKLAKVDEESNSPPVGSSPRREWNRKWSEEESWGDEEEAPRQPPLTNMKDKVFKRSKINY